MNLPNKLSLMRIALLPVLVVVYLIDFAYAPLIAIGVFLLAAFTDFLDGYIARKYDMVTDLGKLLDPIADKLLVVFSLFLIAYSSVLQPDWICAVLGSVIMARELLISIVRQIAASKNVIIHANIYGKIKTFVQDIAIPLLFLLNMKDVLVGWSPDLYTAVYYAAYAAFGAATLLTIISGVIYLVQNKKVFAAAEQ